MLSYPAKDYTVGMILRMVEGLSLIHIYNQNQLTFYEGFRSLKWKLSLEFLLKWDENPPSHR